jgi:hypothetical protein
MRPRYDYHDTRRLKVIVSYMGLVQEERMPAWSLIHGPSNLEILNDRLIKVNKLHTFSQDKVGLLST